MTTKLAGPLKRELTIRGQPYTLTTSPEGLSLVPKGRRKGYRLSWDAFVSGEAALAVALAASVKNGPHDSPRATKRRSAEADSAPPHENSSSD